MLAMFYSLPWVEPRPQRIISEAERWVDPRFRRQNLWCVLVLPIMYFPSTAIVIYLSVIIGRPL